MQVVRNTDFDIADVNLTHRKLREALKAAERLEPSERRLVAVELATRAWLKRLTLMDQIYPDFESFLWEHFSKKSNPSDYVIASMDALTADTDAIGIYCTFLRSMFAASGKTRSEFYRDMLVEAGIDMELSDAVFGEKAIEFYEKTVDSIHREHLLVFYSTGLLLRALATYYKDSSLITRKELRVMYGYFEDNFPLCGKFRSYTKDDTFFKSGIKGRCIPEL